MPIFSRSATHAGVIVVSPRSRRAIFTSSASPFAPLLRLLAAAGKDGKLKLTRNDAMSIAQLHRVWHGAQERISFHRRVPSPGSLKPEKQDKRIMPRKPTAPVTAV